MTRTRSPWSKSIGERGQRVRLYEARPGGPIMRSTWINGKEDRREPGGLWHTLRRKWATERKGYPVKDGAAASGWRDERTILTSYQQADAATVRQVVLQPTQRLVGS